jgi:hypothetical protein
VHAEHRCPSLFPYGRAKRSRKEVCEVSPEVEVFRNNLCRLFQIDIGGLGLDRSKLLRRKALNVARNESAHRLLDAIE